MWLNLFWDIGNTFLGFGFAVGIIPSLGNFEWFGWLSGVVTRDSIGVAR